VYFSGWFTRRTGKDGDRAGDKYQPMSEAEMDAELDRIEAEDKDG
jgi:hypothetical protein